MASKRNLFSALIIVSAMLTFGCKKEGDTTTSTGGATKVEGDVIKIGEVGSLTGNEATFGTSTHNGIELAIKEQNAAGGINGKKIELTTLDNQGKPEEAATAITKLITQNKVVAVLGEVASSRSIAMAPIAQQYGIPMVSPSSTNPQVTALGDYIFRVCFIDPFQGQVMAKFALDTLKVKKVAILRDVRNDYSVGLANYFIETFKAGGGEIVVDQSYSAGDVDFKAQLTAIREKKPEAVFVPGYYTEVGLVARQAKELGLNVPLMGGDGWDSPKLTEIGGKSIEGSYFSNHYSHEDKAVYVQDFIKKYKADYKVIPDGLAAMGYDAAKVLFEAMKKSPGLTTKEIRDQLALTKDYQGVTGKITINEKRDAVKSAVVLRVDKDGFKYQTTVAP
ncbi:MAG: ABC transporter substrate-binding protein [Bdellovibrionota bacterium]